MVLNDVIIDQFEFLGSKDGNSSVNSSSSSYQNTTSSETGYNDNIETTDVSEDPYKDFGEEINISSDDLPF